MTVHSTPAEAEPIEPPAPQHSIHGVLAAVQRCEAILEEGRAGTRLEDDQQRDAHHGSAAIDELVGHICKARMAIK